MILVKWLIKTVLYILFNFSEVISNSLIIIYRSHYEDMVKLSSEFKPMLEGCLANRSQWVAIEEGKEDEAEVEAGTDDPHTTAKNIEI